MGKPPYDDPDTLDLMRADCVEVASVTHDWPTLPTDEQTLPTGGPAEPIGFDVPADAVALGELHFHLE